MDERLITRILEGFPETRAENADIRRYFTGQSGSPVRAVNFQRTGPRGLQGVFIVKVGKVEWAAAERDFATHQLKRNDPRPLQTGIKGFSEEVEGFMGVAYDVAFGRLMRTRTLGELILGQEADRADAARHISALVRALREWNSGRVHNGSRTYAPHELLRIALERERPRRKESLRQRLSNHLQNWPFEATPSLVIRSNSRELPNPVMFLEQDLWLPISVKLPYHLDRMHGDLNVSNIICLPRSPIPPAVIDFSDFKEHGISLFDLAYLEFDILQRTLPVTGPTQRNAWLELMRLLTDKILPDSESEQGRILSAAFGDVWQLIAPIRQGVMEMHMSISEPTLAECFEGVWWTMIAAAGLNFARKGTKERNPLERVCALLWAAHGLDKVAKTLNLNLRKGPRAELIDWVEGGMPSSTIGGNAASTLPRVSPIFVGRTPELERGLAGLQSGWPLVCVEGYPGVGKSAFANLLARICMGDPMISAPSLTAENSYDVLIPILPLHKITPRRVLSSVWRLIFERLGATQLMIPLKSRADKLFDLLERTRALIVIDNVAVSSDATTIDWITRLPAPSQVIIVTTERSQIPSAWPVTLGGLSIEEAMNLINSHAVRLQPPGFTLVGEQDIVDLITLTGGTPGAIVSLLEYTCRDQIDFHTMVEELGRCTIRVGQALDKVLSPTWRRLPEGGRNLLRALASVEGPLDIQEVRRLLQHLPDPNSVFDSLAKCWLVERRDDQFGLLPVTRAYVSSRPQIM